MKKFFYVIDFENYGGLVMPLIFELKFTNGKSKIYRIPAEIWRRNSEKVSKLVMTSNEVESIVLDPMLETADIDLSNNHFPPKMIKSRFKMFKSGSRSGNSFNEMRRAQMEQRMIETRKKAEKAKAEKAKAEKAKVEKAKAEKAKAEKIGRAHV